MLVALTANGEYFICSSDMSRQQLKEQRACQSFFCPQCKEPVKLKVGEMKVPHFAHLAKNHCERMFSEGESAQHLQGKEQLYKLFQRLQLQVELESYIQELAQRPDLLVTDKRGRQFAIEFQCSVISPERLRERTNGYLSRNITPIWIFITPSQKIDDYSKVQKISLSPLLQQMLRGHEPYWQYIVTYNPSLQSFIYFSNLLHLQDNQFITKCLKLPIEYQLFPFYEPAPLQQEDIKQYVTLYRQYQKRFAQVKLMTNRQGVNDPFLRACYELRFSSQALPWYVGIPVSDAMAIPMFTIEWQVRLLYYAFLHKKGLQVFTEQDVVNALQWMQIPLTINAQKAIWQYIDYFKKLLLSTFPSMSTIESYLANQLLSNRKIEKIIE